MREKHTHTYTRAHTEREGGREGGRGTWRGTPHTRIVREKEAGGQNQGDCLYLFHDAGTWHIAKIYLSCTGGGRAAEADQGSGA